jgi:hypothetical protein
MTKDNAALARASAAALIVVSAVGATFAFVACSSSSSGEGADAGKFGALPPLGVPLADCEPDACPAPATCGGTLLGPTSPVSYCTIVCSKNSDCPSGDICTKQGLGQCLKSCTADSDCMNGFACNKSGGYCWSPYNGADAIPDAQAPMDSQTASHPDAGSPEAAADTGATIDAGADEGTDAGASDGSTGDGATADAPRAGTDN